MKAFQTTAVLAICRLVSLAPPAAGKIPSSTSRAGARSESGRARVLNEEGDAGESEDTSSAPTTSGCYLEECSPAGPTAGPTERVPSKDDFRHSLACRPCAGTTADDDERDGFCTIEVTVNYFSGDIGYYNVEGCEGLNPTLRLSYGRTYVFEQRDMSNWGHQLGFSYGPDGASPLDPGTVPPSAVDANGCAESFACPSPAYALDHSFGYQNLGGYGGFPGIGVPPGDPAPEADDNGADRAGSVFSGPIREWELGHVVALKFDRQGGFDGDIFYFARGRAGTSARIKFLDDRGELANPEDGPALPYRNDAAAAVSDFDRTCGAPGVGDYRDPSERKACQDFYLCEEDGVEGSAFAACVEAMSCRAASSMSTGHGPGGGTLGLFVRQMIPNHRNAVDMAKSFLKMWDSTDQMESDVCWNFGNNFVKPLLYEIVHEYTSQIDDMERALVDILEFDERDGCVVELAKSADDGRQENEDNDATSELPGDGASKEDAVPAERPREKFVAGVDCKPCEDDGDGACVLRVRVDPLAGKEGSFEIRGCDGFNPTLHLAIGRDHVFDQSDVSNWHHMIDFSYDLLGYAALGLGDFYRDEADCLETFTCPAAFYFLDDDFPVHEYANFDDRIGFWDDGYEEAYGAFTLPIEEWQEMGAYSAILNFDVEDYDGEDLVYFSTGVWLNTSPFIGRIKLLDADGNIRSRPISDQTKFDPSPFVSVASPFASVENQNEYLNSASEYDRACGTFELVDFQTPGNDRCPDRFVCSGDKSGAGPGNFADCVDSMNCALLNGITAPHRAFSSEKFYEDIKEFYEDVAAFSSEKFYEDVKEFYEDVALLLSRMVPLHDRAINLARALMKSGEIDCDLSRESGSASSEEIDVVCTLESIARTIIYKQRHQIKVMDIDIMGCIENRFEDEAPTVNCSYTYPKGNATEERTTSPSPTKDSTDSPTRLSTNETATSPTTASPTTASSTTASPTTVSPTTASPTTAYLDFNSADGRLAANPIAGTVIIGIIFAVHVVFLR